MMDPTTEKTTCIPGQLSQDMRPLAVFVYVPIIAMGCAFLLGLFKPKKMVCFGVLIVAVGAWQIERSIEINMACDYGQDTGPCADGKNNTVEVTTEVSSAVCYSGSNPVFPPGPFATNLPTTSTCLSYGCKSNQCLQMTTRYNDGKSCVPNGSPTMECVDGQSTSSAAPVILFAGLGIVIFGAILAAFTMFKAGDGGDKQRLLDP
jgi:hypothetical protein